MNVAPSRDTHECEVCGEEGRDVRGHEWSDLDLPRVVAHSGCAYNPLTDDRSPREWYRQEVGGDPDAGAAGVLVTDGGIDPLVCPRGHHSVKVHSNRFACQTCRNQDRDTHTWDKSELVDLRERDPPLEETDDDRVVATDGGVDVPSEAVPIDFEALRDNDSESWDRAAPADAEVTLGERPGLFVVQLPDSDDAHNLSLVEVRGGPWVGWCSCEGYQNHHHCAHLATLRKMAVTNDNLTPTLEEDPRHDVDADVVEHVDDQDDDQDAASPDVVDTAPKEGSDQDVVDVGPQGSDAESRPATASDPWAEEIADDVPSRFVMTLGGDTYVRRAGYARIARHHDLRLQLEEVVGAHETEWEHSKYRARVIDANGSVVVDAEVGSAHVDQEDMTGAQGELDELAATRAARRAIEWATGAGSTLEADGRRDDRARADGGVER